MNDQELRDSLLAEVPAAAPGYWSRIDDSLAIEASAANDTGDIGPLDITAPDPAPRRRLPRWPLAAAAAVLVVLAGWLITTRVLIDDNVVTTGYADDPLSLPRALRPGPRQNLDHWHAVYGVWDCTRDDGNGDWVPAFQSNQDDTGIHSHGDGMIYIHPFFEHSAEENATFSHFESEMHIDVTSTAITLDDGTELRAGTTCDGAPAVVQMLRWEFDLDLRRNPDMAPRVVLENFGAERFYNDREVWTIALAPIGADIPLPPAERFGELDNWIGGDAIDEWLTRLGPAATDRSVPAGRHYVIASPGIGRDEVAHERFRQLNPSGGGPHTQAIPETVEQLAFITSAFQRMELFRFQIADNLPDCFAILNAVPTDGFSICPPAETGPGLVWDLNPRRTHQNDPNPDPDVDYQGTRPEFEQLDFREVLLHDAPPDAVWMVVEFARWRAVAEVIDGVAYAEWHDSFGDAIEITLLDAELNPVWSDEA